MGDVVQGCTTGGGDENVACGFRVLLMGFGDNVWYGNGYVINVLGVYVAEGLERQC